MEVSSRIVPEPIRGGTRERVRRRECIRTACIGRRVPEEQGAETIENPGVCSGEGTATDPRSVRSWHGARPGTNTTRQRLAASGERLATRTKNEKDSADLERSRLSSRRKRPIPGL